MKTPKKSAPSAPTPPSDLVTRTSKVSGYTLIGLLGVGLISCGWLLLSGKVQMLPPKLTRDAAVHGEVTHSIAKQLSKAWFPEHAANLERGASWLLFHDTGPRVRPGCPGWLFLTDEMRINPHARANADSKARAVIDVQQRLHQRGIRLLVAVVPDKSRIAADQLCGLDRPAELDGRAMEWTTTLNQAGVPALNLASTLQPLGAAAFLRTDTHWSETGSKAAAHAIAQQVQALGIRATPQKTFATHSGAAALRAGDLVRLAGLDWLPMSWQPTPETVAATQVSEEQAAVQDGGDNLDDLFGDDGLPNVALIGTSFSRNSNFLGFLELALGAPVGSFAKDGGEFSGGANDYFSNPAFRETPPKLLIWEIPERDLQTPYEAIGVLGGKE
ncbi:MULTISPECIES: alginate O-acetyltransferase AlgX-related protein [Pseudomonas]|uniref:alginate O-acetyltransferase AlgX-related protein n=1 Tax=Pseudomonas TaxID=286 RepID=UPI001BEA1D61|nr:MULTISPECIES: cell division protein FtsQ [Pseudomonas]MBT2338467.1 cell division protein FtsQ [Pseudomonas fluorescens]MCD4531170.1 cell division protein FtsQ [Pseudomonas sp. C3-2018]